jgi:hypothetical protein
VGAAITAGLCAAPYPAVSNFVSLGSPLGIPKIVFDRLVPQPHAGTGRWPPRLRRWTNIADRADVVALTKQLAPQFGAVTDVLVDNGARAHDMRPYLTAAETGLAILKGQQPDRLLDGET